MSSRIQKLFARAILIRKELIEKLPDGNAKDRLIRTSFHWSGGLRKSWGRCHFFQSGRREIRLSLPLFTIEGNESQFEDTVRHELAHAALPTGHGHNHVWESVAVLFGATPSACNGKVVGIASKGIGRKVRRFEKLRRKIAELENGR